ncbi:MAG: hypothetical protein DMG27_02165 [Acidobacteria bacterium]|nr:MAG: hypothetical protein DMG27_02165 [Acidobacteriota bacterium]
MSAMARAGLLAIRQGPWKGKACCARTELVKADCPSRALNGAAAWFSVVVENGIHNLRVELGRRSQSQPEHSVALVERLTRFDFYVSSATIRA